MKYAKLNARIVEKFGRATRFAEAMEMSDATMSQRLNGDYPWKINEVEKAVKLLGIKRREVAEFFLPES